MYERRAVTRSILGKIKTFVIRADHSVAVIGGSVIILIYLLT